jgi:hypothetical protein
MKKRIALLVGSYSVLENLHAIEDNLNTAGFTGMYATSFEEAIEKFRQKISIMIIFAHFDFYKTPLDAYTGKLPPTIYYHMHNVETRPNNPQIRCVYSDISIVDIMKVVEEIALK